VLTVLVELEYHGSSQIPSTSGQGRITLESKGTSTAPIFPTGIQVAVHTTHEQSFTPQANRSGSNVSGKPHGKPHELIVGIVDDYDIEGMAEKYSRVTPMAE